MLQRTETEVSEERNSRKEPFDDAEAQALVDQVSTVLVAKGKKVRELAAADATLDDLKGPTGNYRAPIVRVGDRLLVGFHAETLESLVTA
ncbi:MAG: hypothetical protein AAFY88_07255 [Acidobacteriota bacterium]